jgi:tetratricopeptide (TPR) repeat protein
MHFTGRTGCNTRQCLLAMMVAALSWAGSAGVMVAQAVHDHSVAMRPIPREILERPVNLRSGIGNLHQKVTTKSTEAQAFYDQGLNYLHSYVWIEAIRSFHQALRLDPKMGMAFLGLADAYIGLQDVAAARGALQHAAELEPVLSKDERVRLAICDAEVEYLESGDPEKYVAYRQAIEKGLTADPNDPWLWIQRGLAADGSPFAHGQAGNTDTIAFYRMALEISPENLAAHHYYAHTLENIGRLEEALQQSEIYVRLAPAIPHAHHMHGHELMRLGQMEGAIAEYLKARELEDAYYRSEQIPPRYDWHHGHNLILLGMCYESLGQMKSAEGAFREAFELPAYTDFLEYNRKAWPEFLLLRGRDEEALAASEELANAQGPLARLAGRTLAGEALLALGRSGEAAEQERLAEEELEHLPVSQMAVSPFPATLRAALLLRAGQTGGSSMVLELVRTISRRPGPDAWMAARFELEALAKCAQAADDWALAESIAREMVKDYPSYSGGHYELGLVERHRGQADAARQEFAEARKGWTKADEDLPELRDLGGGG